VFLSRLGMVPAIRAFVDFLVESIEDGARFPGECPLVIEPAHETV
jgi:hypothetical protein